MKALARTPRKTPSNTASPPKEGAGAKSIPPEETKAMAAVSANKLELLQIADAVACEKSIDRGVVIAAMEDAIAKAARAGYGSETDVHAEIDAKKGELRLSRHMLVVEQVENPANQISLKDAQRANPGAQVGDTIADTLPPLEYGRIAAQSAKQVIVQKVREAERDRQYQEFKDRIGDIVNGIVKRVEYGSVIVDLGRGEKIDIIPWCPDIATFVVNALAPAEVAKVVIDEDRERIEVVVPDTNNQLSLAIGRRGQNVRLASQLTGWDIDILTEQEESERRQAEFEKRTKIFMDALNVDEVVGQLLASEGFTSVEELAFVEVKEIAGIEGFDEDTANELQTRARDYLGQIEEELDAKRLELGVEDALKEIPGVTTAILVKLGENGVKTVEDLAGCATDDLAGWTERKDGETKHEAGFLDGLELSREECEAMIMQARLKAGWITEPDPTRPATEEAAEAAEPAQ